MSSDEEYCPEIPVKLTGLAIKYFLLAVGEGNPYWFYKCFKKVKPSTSYNNVRRYFYFLKKLGLIEPVRKEPSKHGMPKTYYRIVPGMEDDPRWFAPQAELYPETRLGAKRYVPKYGRYKGEEKVE